ncbi:hypothetical protein Gpo141_00013228 [Globisporangium polare]
MFKWGVRVQHDARDEIGWICLGSQLCRDTWTFFPLHSGKSSNATKHLKDKHQITSMKTHVENERKRTREDEVDRLTASPLYSKYPGRLRVLLEARRIVYNSLPFRSGEYEDSRIINDIVVKDQFCAVINSKTISHAIVELYASTKRGVIHYFKQSQQTDVPRFTMVTDFWTSSPQAAKYLGVRVYFVDQNWKLASVLLETRRFDPEYRERKQGTRVPFRRWIDNMLSDFGLTKDNFLDRRAMAGATSSG